MSDFFAPRADWWRKTRNRIPRPLEREDALIDLRWWQDQVLIGREKRIPTSEALGEEWGWGEKKARLLLQRESEWSDPHKAEAWAKHRGRTEGGRRADGGRTEGGTDEGSSETVPEKGRTEGGRRADGGRKKGDTRGDPPTPTPTPTQVEPSATAPPLVLLTDPPPPDPPTEIDATPPWARTFRPVPAIEAMGAVVRALTAIRGKLVNPERCYTEAKLVHALWQANGRPPLAELAAEIELVAGWAQQDDATRGLNPDGSRWTDDRSRKAAWLLDPKRFGDELDAATRWEAGTDPPRRGRGDHPGNGVVIDDPAEFYRSRGLDPDNPAF